LEPSDLNTEALRADAEDVVVQRDTPVFDKVITTRLYNNRNYLSCLGINWCIGGDLMMFNIDYSDSAFKFALLRSVVISNKADFGVQRIPELSSL